MTDAPSDGRCTRNTLAGQRCKRARYRGDSCHQHLTDEERARGERLRQWAQAQADILVQWNAARRSSDPVCWSWTQPAEAQLRGLPHAERLAAMYAWHQGRCAICGHPADVTDHDHATARVRGKLCRSCNASEGYGNGGVRNVFDRYRDRNPASIWQVQEIYFNAFTRRHAEPQTTDYDRWRDTI